VHNGTMSEEDSMSEASEKSNISMSEEDIREGLESCLEHIQPFGTFAVFNTYTDAPNPGIHLMEGGSIGLPLSDRDADALIAASHQAPFGKGEQTIVDTNIRKTWEISAADFELKNPAWQASNE
jgi:hypothetical protein